MPRSFYYLLQNMLQQNAENSISERTLQGLRINLVLKLPCVSISLNNIWVCPRSSQSIQGCMNLCTCGSNKI